MTNSSDFDALIDQGIAQQQSGNLAGAITAFTRAHAQRPDDAEILCLLGAAEHVSGETENGMARLQRAVELEPGEPRFRIQLGLALGRDGHPRDAHDHIERAAGQLPPTAQLIKLQLNLALQAGLSGIGYNLARTLVQIASGDEEAWRLWARAAFEHGDVAGARQAQARAMHIHGTETAPDCVSMARFELQLNDPGAAKAWSDKARALDATYLPAQETAAQIALYTGQAEEAHRLTTALLAQQPDNIPALCTALELTSGDDEADLAMAETVLARDDIPDLLKIPLAFAVAQAHDHAKRFDLAGQAAIRANQVAAQARIRAGDSYDPARALARTHLAQALFSPDFIRQVQTRTETSSPSTPRPIFIIGPPRSGTSLTEKTLAGAHSAAGLGERGATMASFNQALDLAETSGVETARQQLLPALAQLAVAERREWAKIAGERDVVIDKTPAHLDACGWLACLFPNAVFVSLNRNVRDTAISCFFQNLPNEYGYSTDLANTAAALEHARETARHWKSCSLDWVEFEYDAFVSDPEPQARELFRLCNLDWNNDVLNPARPGGLRAFAALAATRTISDHRKDRWENYRDLIERAFPAVQSAD
jgi:tetratricopeptide (TPR) repeat protein